MKNIWKWIVTVLVVSFSFSVGGFVLRSLDMSGESQKPLEAGENSPRMDSADFEKYNKTLSRHKVTGVTDLEGPYKK